MRLNTQQWIASGSPWVWLTAGAVSLSLVMVFGILILIAVNGLAHFWPARIAALDLVHPDGKTERLLGEIVDEETVAASRVRDMGGTVPENTTVIRRLLIKVGNRDLNDNDFRWIAATDLKQVTYPIDAITAERAEWGNFYGFVTGLRVAGKAVPMAAVADEFAARLANNVLLRAQIARVATVDIGEINRALEDLRVREKGVKREHNDTEAARIAAERMALKVKFDDLSAKLAQLAVAVREDVLLVSTIDGTEREIPLEKIVRVFRPNAMNWIDKARHYGVKLREFVGEGPREANTEGGVYPAIFGTVLMVIVMSIIATPFGVIAAIYLREYAKPGPITSAIRIAVNNLAGVPSVVYGVFGLGFFVYFVGSSIDAMFFAARLPAPTFGTPGLLWSALTLALLTVPVVIVATEEGLTRIPRAIREGSLALGATKAETLWRTVLPMATPAMMTGLILAVARAAGEVAPLMMVGVVKLAPALPLDTVFPYLHLDRKFMHLGFHIYDVGFQSPNVEAARPLVYATALLLVIIIMSLNLAAIQIRNRLRERYHATDH